ncbi:hypothetical protein ACOALA_13380 [Alicyclobacillus acidoterrestris]|uniref:hypothetical protein n=1 Tax=Alicyclobacillus acidoterrestris TaxID=1450 RepID=UPI003F53459B
MMNNGAFVSHGGKVTRAEGPQPKDALLFTPPKQTPDQILRSERESWVRNSKLIQSRLQEATKR